MRNLSMFMLLAILLGTCQLASAATRVWIDTDPACGTGSANDADDCIALLYLLAHPGFDVVGISTSFGNTSVGEATSIARTMARLSGTAVRVHEGAKQALSDWHDNNTIASAAMAGALANEKLTILALGPLTNLAAVLSHNPSLANHVERIYAVMGRAPGHIFHPAEGAPGALFAHGPVFTDFNFAKDPQAAAIVMRTKVPVTLVPYVAGIRHAVTDDDLRTLSRMGGVAGWVSRRSWGWLNFWKRYVGRSSFAPFDLVMAVAAGEPGSATCTREHIAIRRDKAINSWGGPISVLFVGPRASQGSREVSVCWSLARDAFEALRETLHAGTHK
jgi:purine nucleosidase